MPLRFKTKEFVLMTLPVLIIAGALWWKTRPAALSEIATIPPENLDRSTMRLVLANWKVQTPSPGEIATGHTLKWGTRLWVGGQRQGKLRNLMMIGWASGLVLHYRQGTAWHVVKRPGGWNGLRAWMSEGDLSHRLDVALPMNLVPPDADEVRLRGHLEGVVFERIGKFDHTHNIKSASVDLLVKTKNDKLIVPQVNQQSPLKIENPTVRIMGAAADDENRHSSNARVIAKLQWNHYSWQREKPIGFTTQQVQLLDEKGNDWLLHQPSTKTQSGSDNLGDTERFSTTGGIQPTEPHWMVDVQTDGIPLGAGELRLRALVAPEWKNGHTAWPTQVEAVVRPRWLTIAPQELKVEKVSVAIEPVPFRPHKTYPVVSVELRYTGDKPFFARGESGASCGYPDDPVTGIKSHTRPCWEQNYSAIAQISFGQYITSYPIREAKPSENELILSWSQRLEDVPASATMPRSDGVDVLEPKIDKDRIVAKYALKDWSPSQRNKVFIADVGLRDQGLIPIRLALPVKLN